MDTMSHLERNGRQDSEGWKHWYTVRRPLPSGVASQLHTSQILQSPCVSRMGLSSWGCYACVSNKALSEEADNAEPLHLCVGWLELLTCAKVDGMEVEWDVGQQTHPDNAPRRLRKSIAVNLDVLARRSSCSLWATGEGQQSSNWPEARERTVEQQSVLQMMACRPKRRENS